MCMYSPLFKLFLVIISLWFTMKLIYYERKSNHVNMFTAVNKSLNGQALKDSC